MPANLLLLLAPVAMLAGAMAPATTITGTWLTEDRDAHVEVAPCGKSLCGRVVKFLVAPPDGIDQCDTENPDPKLRKRRLLGLAVLTGFARDGDRWRGRIYDPKSGKSYRSVLERQGNTLTVKGCIGPFCQAQQWRRVR